MKIFKGLVILVLAGIGTVALAAAGVEQPTLNNLASITGSPPTPPLELPIPGYLIIYAHAFRPEVCPELDSFIQWKLRKGLNVYTMDLDNMGINGDTGDVHHVKSYIEWWYNSTHRDPGAPGYVLLVGDAFDCDTTYTWDQWERYWPSMCGDDSHVPTYVYGSVADPAYPHYFSDYFYQLMDNDSFPDLVVGRWCVENQYDLEAYVTKTLDYERESNLGWGRVRALFMCQENGDFDPEEDPSPYHDVVESCMTHLPLCCESLDRRGWNSTNAIVEADINSSQGVGILTYVGHGQYHALGNPWNTQEEAFGSTEIYNLSNTLRYPIMLAFCSIAGRFTWRPGEGSYTECATEAWTRHSATSGGVAALGASAGIGGSLELAEPYFVGLFDNKLNCGLAKNYATTYLYESNGYQVDWLQYAFGYNWIGDPELDVWRGRPTQGEFMFVPNQAMIEVIVWKPSPHTPLPGTKVCLYREGDGYQRVTYTDSCGKAYFPYPGLFGTYHLTATNQWGGPNGEPFECIVPACTSFVWTGAWIWPPSPKNAVDDKRPEQVSWQLEFVLPNPMRSQATISYSVGGTSSGNVELGIYDASGREVKVLASGSQAPGHYQVTWDGCDATGTRCPAGVYFVKMSSTSFNANERLLLIR